MFFPILSHLLVRLVESKSELSYTTKSSYSKPYSSQTYASKSNSSESQTDSKSSYSKSSKT